MEDVGNAEGEGKHYAKHSRPGKCSELSAVARVWARMRMEQRDIRMASRMGKQGWAMRCLSTHHWPYMPGRAGQHFWFYSGHIGSYDSLKLRERNSSANVIVVDSGAPAARLSYRELFLEGDA